jgi:hypothetical protein
MTMNPRNSETTIGNSGRYFISTLDYVQQLRLTTPIPRRAPKASGYGSPFNAGNPAGGLR